MNIIYFANESINFLEYLINLNNTNNKELSS